MSDYHAQLVVCDDVAISLSGKINITGAYTADILINSEQMVAPQIVFFFFVEGAMSELPKTVTCEVTLPGEEPRQFASFTPIFGQNLTDRKRWFLRLPYVVPLPVLRVGPLRGKVIMDIGEIDVVGPWITNTPASS